MKTLLIHPGTQHAHPLACQLHRNKLLYRFVTGIGFSNTDPLLKLLPGSIKQKLSNRILDCSIPPSLIKSIPLPELMSLREINLGAKVEHSIFKRNQSFQRRISQKLLDQADSIIGFDTSSWIVMGRSQKPFVLDQSIAHPEEKKNIFAELRLMYPEWIEDIPAKKQEHLATEATEHQLATKIVVASTFTLNSLVKQGVDRSKIVLNPYGVADSFFRPKQKKTGKIRFVYLGVLGARKGLPFLLDSWKERSMWQAAELWVAGPATQHAVNAVEATRGVTYKGLLPRNEIPTLLDECDCLVFPSFFEGFGQVILEAMAAGLAVISTGATAAPDIIEDNVDGMIISRGDSKSLGEKLQRIATDPSECYAMGKRGREKARGFSWNAYGDRWRTILHQL